MYWHIPFTKNNVRVYYVCRPEESEEEMALRKEGEKVFEEEQRKFLKEDNTPGL